MQPQEQAPLFTLPITLPSTPGSGSIAPVKINEAPVSPLPKTFLPEQSTYSTSLAEKLKKLREARTIPQVPPSSEGSIAPKPIGALPTTPLFPAEPISFQTPKSVEPASQTTPPLLSDAKETDFSIDFSKPLSITAPPQEEQSISESILNNNLDFMPSVGLGNINPEIQASSKPQDNINSYSLPAAIDQPPKPENFVGENQPQPHTRDSRPATPGGGPESTNIQPQTTTPIISAVPQPTITTPDIDILPHRKQLITTNTGAVIGVQKIQGQLAGLLTK